MTTTRDILAIDDEPVVLQGITRICDDGHISIDCADGVSSALARLETTAYRLILCDIMMPGQDGFQLLAEMARRRLETPVVITTGYSTVENAMQSLACGALDFIPKPFTADEVLAVIHRGLACSHLKSAAPARWAAAGSACAGLSGCHRLGQISWMAVEPSGCARVGVCEAFVDTVRPVEHVEILAAGAEVVAGSACAVVVGSSAMRFNVMSPLGGRILEVNDAVSVDCALLAGHPHTAGWLYRVVPSDLEYDCRWLVECGSGGTWRPPA